MTSRDDTFWFEFSPRPNNPVIGKTYHRSKSFRWERLALVILLVVVCIVTLKSFGILL